MSLRLKVLLEGSAEAAAELYFSAILLYTLSLSLRAGPLWTTVSVATAAWLLLGQDAAEMAERTSWSMNVSVCVFVEECCQAWSDTMPMELSALPRPVFITFNNPPSCLMKHMRRGHF